MHPNFDVTPMALSTIWTHTTNFKVSAKFNGSSDMVAHCVDISWRNYSPGASTKRVRGSIPNDYIKKNGMVICLREFMICILLKNALCRV